jgi:hypothetical protein
LVGFIARTTLANDVGMVMTACKRAESVAEGGPESAIADVFPRDTGMVQ